MVKGYALIFLVVAESLQWRSLTSQQKVRALTDNMGNISTLESYFFQSISAFFPSNEELLTVFRFLTLHPYLPNLSKRIDEEWRTFFYRLLGSFSRERNSAILESFLDHPNVYDFLSSIPLSMIPLKFSKVLTFSCERGDKKQYCEMNNQYFHWLSNGQLTYKQVKEFIDEKIDNPSMGASAMHLINQFPWIYGVYHEDYTFLELVVANQQDEWITKNPAPFPLLILRQIDGQPYCELSLDKIINLKSELFETIRKNWKALPTSCFFEKGNAFDSSPEALELHLKVEIAHIDMQLMHNYQPAFVPTEHTSTKELQSYVQQTVALMSLRGTYSHSFLDTCHIFESPYFMHFSYWEPVNNSYLPLIDLFYSRYAAKCDSTRLWSNVRLYIEDMREKGSKFPSQVFKMVISPPIKDNEHALLDPISPTILSLPYFLQREALIAIIRSRTQNLKAETRTYFFTTLDPLVILQKKSMPLNVFNELVIYYAREWLCLLGDRLYTLYKGDRFLHMLRIMDIEVLYWLLSDAKVLQTALVDKGDPMAFLRIMKTLKRRDGEREHRNSVLRLALEGTEDSPVHRLLNPSFNELDLKSFQKPQSLRQVIVAVLAQHNVQLVQGLNITRGKLRREQRLGCLVYIAERVKEIYPKFLEEEGIASRELPLGENYLRRMGEGRVCLSDNDDV